MSEHISNVLRGQQRLVVMSCDRLICTAVLWWMGLPLLLCNRARRSCTQGCCPCSMAESRLDRVSQPSVCVDESQGLLWETSLLDADEGIRFRGYSIPELQVCRKSAHPHWLDWLLLEAT